MRSILSLSLPAETIADLSRKAKKMGLSVSAYVRRLLEHEELLISEEELAQRAAQAHENYVAGKVEELSSFDDLLSAQ
jgi:hypothetical protein